ncbi:MAG: uridine kinase [Flavobacteriales bacterium]|nr:uridine kinase [Flavobacteriales bacterium]
MNDKRVLIVGVVGGSASGKGTVVGRLLAHYGDRAAVLRMDDYYRPLAEVPKDEEGEANFDDPAALDLVRLAHDLDRLKAGHDLHINSYTFNQPGVVPEPLHIRALSVVFLDGLFMLHDEGVRERLDLSILIHATPETRFERRLARDQAERSLTPEIIRYQWERHVRPGDLRFLEPVSHLADVVVDNNRAGEPDLSPALHAIDQRIS